MKYFLLAATLSAASYAELDVVSASDCNGLSNECLEISNADISECTIGETQCSQCQSEYVACQVPGSDFSISQDACDSQLISCVSSAFPQLQGSETSPAPSAATTSTAAASLITETPGTDQCEAVYYQCLVGGKKQDLCLCDLSTCKGEDNAHSRASCSSLSVAATAISTPTCYYGSKETGSSKSFANEAERKVKTQTNVVSGGVASNSLNLIGLAAALLALIV